MNILSFGDIIWDVYPEKSCIGGAMLNFAAHIAKSGADSFLMSSVGNDALGKDALDKLKQFNVNTKYISTNKELPTGQCRVTLDENAVPSFCLLDDVAYDEIKVSSDALGENFDAIAFGSVPIRHSHNIQELKRLIENGNAGKIYCDINLREPFFNNDSVAFCLEIPNILKVSEVELEYIMKNVLSSDENDYEKSARALCKAFPNLELVLITCGEDGAYVYSKEEDKTYYHPSKKVMVVSTVGAGDSFGAAFLVDYLSGKSIEECLITATERSAYVVSHIDAVPN